MKAHLKNYRQAPRKVRLVADVIKGKKVPQALVTLSFLPKRAALPIKKLVESAVANAKSSKGLEADALTVANVRVDKGVTFGRFMPKARGRATPIRKMTSRVSVELTENTPTK